MVSDHDFTPLYASLFDYVRAFLLRIDELHEVTTPNQITFKDPHNMAIVSVRRRKDGIHLAFARGAQLAHRYPSLEGEGKAVRRIKVTTEETFDRLPLQAMIEESLVLAMEHREMKKLRQGLKP